MESVAAHLPCPSHPEDGAHECLPAEQRCAYCGKRVRQTCNGCGRFMTTKEIREYESRCERCC